jgi:hypothetical protein
MKGFLKLAGFIGLAAALFLLERKLPLRTSGEGLVGAKYPRLGQRFAQLLRFCDAAGWDDCLAAY